MTNRELAKRLEACPEALLLFTGCRDMDSKCVNLHPVGLDAREMVSRLMESPEAEAMWQDGREVLVTETGYGNVYNEIMPHWKVPPERVKHAFLL